MQGQLNPDPLSHWLYPLINGLYKVISKENWLKFLLNGIALIGITLSRLFIIYFLYGPIPFQSQNIWDNFEPLLEEEGRNPFLHFIYN